MRRLLKQHHSDIRRHAMSVTSKRHRQDNEGASRARND